MQIEAHMKLLPSPLALGVPLLLLHACATYERPPALTAQLARTEVVIQQADRSGVAVNSLPELQVAKDKYARAKLAADKESSAGDREALLLARQAEVDAQYASAKAQSMRQQDAAREAQRGVDALRQEAQRQPVPPAAKSP
jgi:hypothetical protein